MQYYDIDPKQVAWGNIESYDHWMEPGWFLLKTDHARFEYVMN